MKLIYLKIDGTARLETAKVNQRMIEMPDGYHPITNDSVWQDGRRLRDPILIMVQGVLGPYGANMTEEDTRHVLYEIDVAEKAFKPASVSKMWMRTLAAMAGWLMKYGIPLSIFALAAYLVITQLIKGAP